MTELQLRPIVWEEVLQEIPAQVSTNDLRRLRSDLIEQLRELTVGLLPGHEVQINRRNLRHALTCPASAAETPFEANAVTTSRALGLMAVEAVSQGESLPSAIQSSVDWSLENAHWTASFLVEQVEPVRAATVAYATSWAARALTFVPWSTLQPVRFQQSTIWQSPLGYKKGVALVARPDAYLGRTTERVVLSLGWPDAKVAALDALVIALQSNSAPRRYIIGYPPAGSVGALDIDSTALDAAVADVVEAVGALVPEGRGEPLFTSPGQSCWNCDHRIGCADGVRWMELQPKRRGGLLV